jgi:signal transduction histidine kinase/sensor domain CHASE-containing protein
MKIIQYLKGKPDPDSSQPIPVWSPVFSKRNFSIPLLVFILMVGGVVYLWHLLERQEMDELRLTSRLTAKQVAFRLEDHIEAHFSVIGYLRQCWQIGQINEPDLFYQTVLSLIDEFKGFQAINYIDPHGVIRWVVPEAPNLPAKNRDLHTHPYAAESFILAERTRDDVATPPLELWQGGLGFATYFPLIREGKLEGYLNGVFRVQEFIMHSLDPGISDDYALQLVYDNRVFYSDTVEDSISTECAGEYAVRILNRSWSVRLIPKPVLIQAVSSSAHTIFLIVGLIFAVLSAWFTRVQLLRQLELHRTLRLLRDSEKEHRQLSAELRAINQSLEAEIRKRAAAEKINEVLYEISDTVLRVESISEFFTKIHQSLGKIFDVTNFYVALYDRESDRLTFPFYRDEKGEVLPDSIAADEKKSLTAKVVKAGKPYLVTERDLPVLEKEERFQLVGDLPRVWLGTPLTIRGEVIGAIVVQNYTNPEAYSEEDISLFVSVANQIAVAIERLQSREAIIKSEQRYRDLSYQLSEANNLKELLLDVLAHDLKNSAGVVSEVGNILSEELPGHELIQLVKASGDNLLKVIENVATLSKISLGEEIEKVDLDLTEIIEEVAQEFSAQFKAADLVLESHLEAALPIKANPIIAEVFKNYFSNAVKYARGGSKIIVESRQEDGYVIIGVKDFGPTIPDRDRGIIFERMVRLRTRGKRGHGLGLAIVKRIADAHHGDAWVEPNHPRGNIFYIKLPVS